jgi:hypothetical protein
VDSNHRSRINWKLDCASIERARLGTGCDADVLVQDSMLSAAKRKILWAEARVIGVMSRCVCEAT